MKVLIISNGFPGYGGQATTAYNLHLFLESKNLDTKLLLLNSKKLPESKSFKEFKNSHNLNFLYWFLIRYENTLILIKAKILKLTISKLLFLRLFLNFIGLKIRHYMISQTIKSNIIKYKDNHYDLVITNSPLLYSEINKLFEKTLLIIGSSLPVHISHNKEFTEHQVFENLGHLKIKLSKKIVNNLNKAHIIFNSKLTQSIYEFCGVKPVNRNFLFFNFAPFLMKKDKAFIDRKFDIAFVVSNFDRKIKNPELTYKLFKKFPQLKKVAIGRRSNYFSEISNTIAMDLMTQKELAKILSETKLLIIPSHFDSSPSLMAESVLNGCNILLSKNVGWNETMDERCIVQNFQNHNEWVSKIEYLINNEVENNEFLDIINNSKQEIYSLIDSLTK